MDITSFRGKYRFLSNFHPSSVRMDGDTYPSVEHAFQAAKTFDARNRRAIRDVGTPGIAKSLGRALKLRPDWESVKLGIMLELLRQKFAQNPNRDLLLETGDSKLVEGNDWNDRFWGVVDGEGKNHLGLLLMQVRKEARNAISESSLSTPKSGTTE